MTGGLIINSPTESERLREVTRREFKDFSTEQHRRLLIQDFVHPDGSDRLIGAYRRLAFYYPESVEELVLSQLSVPTYDVSIVANFVIRLDGERLDASRKELFDEFVRQRGRAYSDGLLVRLFQELERQIPTEARRTHSSVRETIDARGLLVQLYGYNRGIQPSSDHYIDSWEESERARFLRALVHDSSQRIDQKVYEIFARSTADDQSALACVSRLIGRGFEKQIREHCERRLGKDAAYTDEIEETIHQLDLLKTSK
jgi:hypothetical protein